MIRNPSTLRMNETGVDTPPITDRVEAVKLYCLSGGTVEKSEIAAWNGHRFEVLPCYFAGNSLVTVRRHPQEHTMQVHYPVDLRITAGDVEGATVAYPNEDNTGWLFAHCDKDYHIDHEHKLRGAVSSAFEDQMHELHGILRTAMYTAFLSSTSDSRDAFGAASRAYGALGDFREDVKARVLAEARKKHIGHYHQNPHDAHIHDPVEEAILHTARTWTLTKAATVWTPIQDAAAAVLKEVVYEHPYETRWDNLVNAPRRGEDPVAGFEYCYTAVNSAAVIEGHDNLPDPNWDFDHLRNGQIVRGNHTYLDGEPKGNAFIFLAVRFKRPIPDGTLPGADIGRVEWEQEPAYVLKVSTAR